MTDDREAIVCEWEPGGRASRRMVFEPRADGYYRREQVWSGRDEWRTVGTEQVDDVEIRTGPVDELDLEH